MIRFKIAGVCLCSCLFSCVTLPKAERKLDSSPTESARYCSLRFQRQDSVVYKTDTVITHINHDYSKVIDSIAELWRVQDSIEKSIHFKDDSLDQEQLFNELAKQEVENVKLHDLIIKLKAQYKPCSPDTIKFTQTKYITDKSQIEYLKGITAKDEGKIERVTKGRNTWRWVGLSLSALLLLIIAALIYANTNKIKLQ